MAHEAVNLDPFYLAASVVSVLSTILIITIYFQREQFRTHPRSLTLWRSLSDAIFAINLIVLSLWEGGKEHCHLFSFFTQFSLLASQFWYFITGLNLLIGLTNPFSSSSRFIPLYHVIAWGLPLISAIELVSYNATAYRESMGTCWIKATDRINSLNVHAWTLFFAPTLVILTFNIIVIIYALFILKRGLSETLRARSAVLRRGVRIVIGHTLYWLCLGVCYYIMWSADLRRNAHVEKPIAVYYIFAVLLGIRGVVEFILWLVEIGNDQSQPFNPFLFHPKRQESPEDPVLALLGPRVDSEDVMSVPSGDLTPNAPANGYVQTSAGYLAPDMASIQGLQPAGEVGVPLAPTTAITAASYPTTWSADDNEADVARLLRREVLLCAISGAHEAVLRTALLLEDIEAERTRELEQRVMWEREKKRKYEEMKRRTQSASAKAASLIETRARSIQRPAAATSLASDKSLGISSSLPKSLPSALTLHIADPGDDASSSTTVTIATIDISTNANTTANTDHDNNTSATATVSPSKPCLSTDGDDIYHLPADNTTLSTGSLTIEGKEATAAVTESVLVVVDTPVSDNNRHIETAAVPALSSPSTRTSSCPPSPSSSSSSIGGIPTQHTRMPTPIAAASPASSLCSSPSSSVDIPTHHTSIQTPTTATAPAQVLFLSSTTAATNNTKAVTTTVTTSTSSSTSPNERPKRTSDSDETLTQHSNKISLSEKKAKLVPYAPTDVVFSEYVLLTSPHDPAEGPFAILAYLCPLKKHHFATTLIPATHTPPLQHHRIVLARSSPQQSSTHSTHDLHDPSQQIPPPQPPQSTDTPITFIDVSPLPFAVLRKHAGWSDHAYLQCLQSQRTAINEQVTQGRSGAFFFYSADRKLIVKSVSWDEAQTLVSILPHYVAHVLSHKDTLLCRYLGLHVLKIHGKYVPMVVMRNLLQIEAAISEAYAYPADRIPAATTTTTAAGSGGDGDGDGAVSSLISPTTHRTVLTPLSFPFGHIYDLKGSFVHRSSQGRVTRAPYAYYRSSLQSNSLRSVNGRRGNSWGRGVSMGMGVGGRSLSSSVSRHRYTMSTSTPSTKTTNTTYAGTGAGTEEIPFQRLYSPQRTSSTQSVTAHAALSPLARARSMTCVDDVILPTSPVPLSQSHTTLLPGALLSSTSYGDVDGSDLGDLSRSVNGTGIATGAGRGSGNAGDGEHHSRTSSPSVGINATNRITLPFVSSSSSSSSSSSHPHSITTAPTTSTVNSMDMGSAGGIAGVAGAPVSTLTPQQSIPALTPDTLRSPLLTSPSLSSSHTPNTDTTTLSITSSEPSPLASPSYHPIHSPSLALNARKVLKDLDVDHPFIMAQADRARVFAALHRDCAWLEDMNLVDYSLLVGVCYQYSDGLALHRNPLIKSETPAQRSDSDSSVEGTLNSEANIAIEEHVTCLPVAYTFGIVDILTTYNCSKRAEHLFKTVVLRAPPTGVSAVAPRPYARRFMRAMDDALKCHVVEGPSVEVAEAVDGHYEYPLVFGAHTNTGPDVYVVQ